MTSAFPDIAQALDRIRADLAKPVFSKDDRVAVSRDGYPAWVGSVAFETELPDMVFVYFDGDTNMNWRGFRTDVWDVKHLAEVEVP